MSQLGTIMSELSERRFDKIGSLFDDGNGSYNVGECLSPTLTWQERDSLELDRGPFNEERDYLMSLISAMTSHAQELPLNPHTFFAPVPDMLDYRSMESYVAANRRWNDFVAIGQKVDHSKNILLYSIAGQLLREIIPHLSSGLGNGFILSHPDLHFGNLYVDDDFNITCIIDWSSASTGPVSELLAIPSLWSSNLPAPEVLTAAFRKGFGQRATKLSPEISHPDFREMSKKMWHFSRLVRLLSKNDNEHFRMLYNLVHKAKEPESATGILWLFHERAKSDENKILLTELQEEAIPVEELQEKELACFSPIRMLNSDAVAVARKLTLVSEMNPGFFADQRLWQWIEDSRKQDVSS